MDDIQRIGVVGCGVMGAGIAEACASKGLSVTIVVSATRSLAIARQRVVRSLDRKVTKGKLTEDDRDAILRSVSFTTELGDLADRDLVVEAVQEDESSKCRIFATLDKVVEDPNAILASNTSAIPIVRLARATDRASHVVGMHFFNPAPTQPLVELVESLLTDRLVGTRVESFLTDTLGKQVIRSRDRAGFVVNALLIPYLLSAIRMVESGFASAADIDRAMTLGCAHPMGPLALVDLIGLDTVAAAAEALYGEFRDQTHSIPPLLARMVEAGVLGRKTGVGFHQYTRQLV